MNETCVRFAKENTRLRAELEQLSDLRWKAEAAFIAVIHRPEMNNVLVGEVRDEAERILTENTRLRELRVEYANHFADVRRIDEWLQTDKPANLSFTDGPERQMAYRLESLRQRIGELERELVSARSRRDYAIDDFDDPHDAPSTDIKD